VTRGAAGLLIAALLLVLVGPHLAPHDPARQFSDYPQAPPMRPRLVDEAGTIRRPFVYPLRPVNRLEHAYAEDRSRRTPLPARGDEPVFLLGSDSLGRDVLARVLDGSRLTLGLALAATALALLLGAIVGAAAGYAGGWLDGVLMRVADFVLVLPGLYVVVALRGALPIVLSTPQVFSALMLVLGLAGWPAAARGVRGILIVERTQEYAEAARAMGAGGARILWRHLLPAARGFLVVQATILVPAFVMAEATLSFAGLGFAPPEPSWGAMLLDASSVRTAADAPWLLSPALAIVLTVLVVQALGPAFGSPLTAIGDVNTLKNKHLS
jgi:peptide/nickel transport system permease protein